MSLAQASLHDVQSSVQPSHSRVFPSTPFVGHDHSDWRPYRDMSDFQCPSASQERTCNARRHRAGCHFRQGWNNIRFREHHESRIQVRAVDPWIPIWRRAGQTHTLTLSHSTTVALKQDSHDEDAPTIRKTVVQSQELHKDSTAQDLHWLLKHIDTSV